MVRSYRTPGGRSHQISSSTVPWQVSQHTASCMLLGLSCDNKAFTASLRSYFVFGQLCLKGSPASHTYPVLSPCLLEPLSIKPNPYSTCHTFEYLREPESALPWEKKNPQFPNPTCTEWFLHTHTHTHTHIIIIMIIILAVSPNHFSSTTFLMECRHQDSTLLPTT